MVEKRPEVSGESEEEESNQRTLTYIAALESYSSCHPEPMNELLEWPYRRFVKAYEAWSRRKLVDELDDRRNGHINALYANSNFDDDKGTRDKYIESLNEYYEKLKNIAWQDSKEVKKEEKQIEEMEENDPFLRAGKRALARVASPKIRN